MSAAEEPREAPGATPALIPPADMPEDLKRIWYLEQIRLLRLRVSRGYFFMGLTGFGAVAGVAMAALGIQSGDPGFYAGTAVAPGIVAGGLWGLRKSASGGE